MEIKMDFEQFARKIENKFTSMSSQETLYVMEVSKDKMWEHYQDAFPAGTNDIYIENRVHDCNCCKQFMRKMGNVVAIIDSEIVSIWDVPDLEGEYKIVAQAMSNLIKSAKIRTIFLTDESEYGKISTRTAFSEEENPTKLKRYKDEGFENLKTWNHFHCELESKYVNPDFTAIRGVIDGTKSVFTGGLEIITPESIEVVIDLINSKSIYKGDEKLQVVEDFKVLKTAYDLIPEGIGKEVFIWNNIKSSGARIKKDVIGSLLVDLSEGRELNSAVKSFEDKTAPTNYKRPSAVVTKGMVTKALKIIEEKGIETSLPRRHATVEDISVNDILFVNRDSNLKMKDSVTDLLMDAVKTKPQSFNGIGEVGIEDFITNVLPTASKVEVFMTNQSVSNLMSLIAPVNVESPNILKWNNNFSWSYNGNITDSNIKEKVKTAGGSVSGILRASLGWKNSYNDYDIHVVEPCGNRIFYSRDCNTRTTGKLDVDMNASGGDSLDAVENVTWEKLVPGDYTVEVNNYCKRDSNDSGFTIETECKGVINTFTCTRPVRGGETVLAVKFNISVTGEFKVLETGKDVTNGVASQELWGIKTEDFIEVSTVLLSPNYWNGQSIGNKHFFFIMKNCITTDDVRGIYNEFLSSDLNEHRKVFEMLGGKMKVEQSDNQLSGIGFSSTKRDSLIVKVSGSSNRTLKVNF